MVVGVADSFQVSLYRQSLLKALLQIPRLHSRVKYLCVSASCCGSTHRTGRGHWIPWSWSYRCEPPNLGPWKSNSALNHWASPRLLDLYFSAPSGKVVFPIGIKLPIVLICFSSKTRWFLLVYSWTIQLKCDILQKGAHSLWLFQVVEGHLELTSFTGAVGVKWGSLSLFSFRNYFLA